MRWDSNCSETSVRLGFFDYYAPVANAPEGFAQQLFCHAVGRYPDAGEHKVPLLSTSTVSPFRPAAAGNYLTSRGPGARNWVASSLPASSWLFEHRTRA